MNNEKYTMDNTEGFSENDLAVLNQEYDRQLNEHYYSDGDGSEIDENFEKQLSEDILNNSNLYL